MSVTGHFSGDRSVGATLYCRPGVAVQLPPQQLVNLGLADH